MNRDQGNCSSQKTLLTTGIWTLDLWFRSLNLNPLDQPAVIYYIVQKHFSISIVPMRSQGTSLVFIISLWRRISFQFVLNKQLSLKIFSAFNNKRCVYVSKDE
jgi:hypothetical protein